MTIKQIFEILNKELRNVYSPVESNRCAYMLMEHLFDVKRIDFILNPFCPIEVQQSEIDKIIGQINSSMPIQYITQRCDFMDKEFFVGSGVLIPRPETEELINMIVKESCGNEKILDIGTGSGVIAIMLSELLPNSTVDGYDISPEALVIAQKNNEKIAQNRVNLSQVDILAIDSLPQSFDVIVSNPPYICEKEKPLMRDNVLNFEPHLALFVPDANPLLFYHKISQLAFDSLRSAGRLYFEINEAYGAQTKSMMEAAGFTDVQIIDDIFDKPRMVKATKI